MYKVFSVEGGYQIFWCPSAPTHFNDRVSYDGHIYTHRNAAHRRCKQLEEELHQRMRRVEASAIPVAARPSAEVWEVLEREATRYYSNFFCLPDGSYGFQFEDEREVTPLSALAYDSELGVYDTRKRIKHVEEEQCNTHG